MRKIPYKTWLWAGVFLLYPWVAHAAGLGRLTVLSALGQPLSAEIELVSVQKDELTTLAARVASPEAFQQANIQYSPALIGMRLSVERRPDGRPYIKIISTRPVNEPFLAVLIELSWAQGRLLREYTALIDPPGYTPTTPAPVASAPVVAQPAAPEAKPIASPPQPEAAAAPSPQVPADKPAASPRPAAAAKAQGSEYAVKRGDTLARIATSVKPEGVTLDQMLLSLYRNNTDAFAGNMNRLKTGRILRVPDKESVAGTAPAEATKEVRVQSSNWNAYRLKLAEAAGTAPAQETTKSAASGKITAGEVKTPGKEAPKEVLKLSKGDTSVPGKAGSGKPVAAKDRLRMLEEEATAREKSLADANDRVAQLEKSIKDMQRLLEMKGVVPPGAKPPVLAPPAPPAKGDQVAKADPAKAPPPAKAELPKAEAPKAEPPKDAAKAPPVEAPKGDQKAGDQKAPPPVEAPKGEAPKADAPKADAPKAAAPKPKPKPVPPPPPVAEPSLVDQIISAATDPMYLAGGLGGLAVLGGGAFWFTRRRRAQDRDEPKGGKTAPTLASAAAAPAAAMAASPMIAPPAAGSDDVDPLAEADLYLNFGRDAQAEEVLKEALAKNPQHEEAQLKLLQIYAGRKDKVEFEKIARNLHTQTAGVGDDWVKAAGMGYAFDPENSLYEAGKSAPAAAAPAAGGAVAGTDLDFDLELAPGASNVTATDLSLDSGEKTMMMQPGELAGLLADDAGIHDITHDSVAARAVTDTAVTPDFTLNIPAGSEPASMTDITVGPAGADPTKTNVTGDSAAEPMVSAIDFNFDTPAVDATTALPPTPAAEPQQFNHDSTVIISPENQDKPADLAMDFDIGSVALPDTAAPAAGDGLVLPLDAEFKLDLGGDATLAPGGDAPAAAPAIPDIKFDDIGLSFDDAPKADAAAAPAPGGAKDDHWYDVQTKFDLAKAYQEMGDKDGAREILQEVIKEGDAAQQAEAKQLLGSLG